jgi:hypothetical protein
MMNVSAAMGGQFAQNAKAFSEEIIEIGPNPLADSTKEKAL